MDRSAERSAEAVDVGLHQVAERVWPMEPEDPPGCWLGIEPTRKPRVVTRRLVAEREMPVTSEVGREFVGDARLILDGLPLDPGQRCALLLCFDDANGLPVDEQHVVGRAGTGDQLPNRYSLPRVKVDVLVVLNDPTGTLQHPVDADASLVLWGDVVGRVGGNHRRQLYEIVLREAGRHSAERMRRLPRRARSQPKCLIYSFAKMAEVDDSRSQKLHQRAQPDRLLGAQHLIDLLGRHHVERPLVGAIWHCAYVMAKHVGIAAAPSRWVGPLAAVRPFDVAHSWGDPERDGRRNPLWPRLHVTCSLHLDSLTALAEIELAVPIPDHLRIERQRHEHPVTEAAGAMGQLCDAIAGWPGPLQRGPSTNRVMTTPATEKKAPRITLS